MRLCLALLLAAGLVGCNHHENENLEPQSPVEDGFYPTTSPEIPEPVRTASRSVFHILVPLQAQAVPIDTTMGRGPALRALYLLDGSLTSIAIAKQIEHCEKVQAQGDAINNPCLIAKNFSSGSGFLAGGNGELMWTAGHVMRDGMGFRERLFSSDESRIPYWPVFVFDRDGHLLVDGASQNLIPWVTSRGVLRSAGQKDEIDPNQDYFAFVLPQVMGRPLNWAGRWPAEGQRVYAIGFPACTGCSMPNGLPAHYDSSDRSPRPNSSGRELFVSFGRRLRWQSKNYYATSVDLVPGNSGGPGVNENGDLVGIAILTGRLATRHWNSRMGAFVVPPN